jgi:two-component SAPR family response regulator
MLPIVSQNLIFSEGVKAQAMKAILLDDESLALTHLDYLLAQFKEIEVAGKFADPIQGKETILREEVDVVFLDIHLPEINGIELAEQLLERKPRLNVVFVTAFDDYALKAFELNALDYLLKPVRPERLRITVQRIRERTCKAACIEPIFKRPLRMKLFRQALIETKDGRFAAMHWRTSKAQELFLYLLHHRGKLVRKSALIEMLWPEYDPDKAYSQLYTAVYHIRKTLEPFRGHFQLTNVMDGYILNTENVRLDVEEWENCMNARLPLTAETMKICEQAMELYTGDYLQEYDYWWAESERQRLKSLWVRSSNQMAEWYVANHQPEKAAEMYLEICKMHPLAEEAYFALMKLYAEMKNPLLVHRQYRLLTKVLLEELNERPRPYITEWYRNWSRSLESRRL